ncbi:MAG TPA: hypothetical protein VFJ78_03830 [Gaiellaceae bacterium]|nr:hypothetical protein [Gaiellaceae bacterium]
MRILRKSGKHGDDPVRRSRRTPKWAFTSFGAILATGAFLIFATGAVGTGTPTIASDYADYNPGQTVTLTGTNWDTGGSTVHIVVNDSVGNTWQHTADVTPASDGSIKDVFQLPTTFIAQYSVNASQTTSSGTLTASSSFTDANASASIDQCANDPAPSPSTDGCSASASDWVNGNLGASKSSYFEGDSIPYRLAFGNLSLASHSVTIEWDTTKSGTHAIDYLTSFNRTVATADPCLGVSGCSASTTFPIPADPQVTGGGVTPVAGVFRLYGGTITSVSAYSYADGAGFSGDKSARITINFTASQANPVLAWGGHISTRADWGQNLSAVAISGSPYHSRLIDLDGAGGNQDRSLSADAVIFPASITIIKDATPNGSTSFPFTASPSPLSNFSLVDDGTASNTKVFSNITTFQTYTVAETVPSGWSLTGVQCSVTSANGGSQSTSGATTTINLKEGENVTCTYSDLLQTGTLIVKKVVINDNGGTKIATDFSFQVNGGTATSFLQDGADTLKGKNTLTVNAGTYTVTEPAVTGYTTTYDNCSNVAVANGGSQTCTITNNDQAGTLIVKKVVINDNGGTKIATDFSFQVNGGTATSFLQDGADTLKGKNTLTVDAGTYTVTEPAVYGYTTTYDNCSSVAVTNGGTTTCTVTNDDQPGTIVVIKNAKPASGNFAFTTTGTGYNAFGLTGATTNNGNKNSQTLNAGSYTVQEGTQLGWTLTGIGGSTDPNTPYNCVVTGSGGSSGLGDLNTQTATISLKNGDTVTCTFENTGNGATRTQGFWATHPQLANLAWFGGSGFGHTFPGVANVGGIGDTSLCGRNIDTLGKLMGGFWSDISKTSTGKKRSATDQARMQLLQQLLAAELNASAFGSLPAGGSGMFAQWESAFCSGTNLQTALQQAASFNTQGDSSTFTPGTSANSKVARSIADIPFWDKPTGV